MLSKKFELKGSRDVSQLGGGGGKAKEEPMSEDDEDEDEPSASESEEEFYDDEDEDGMSNGVYVPPRHRHDGRRLAHSPLLSSRRILGCART